MAERGFFPIFLDVRNKNILFVGAGKIAARRIKVMSDFSCRITVVSPDALQEIKTLAEAGRIVWKQGSFSESLLEGVDIVLACTDNAELNHNIVKLCNEKHILVNNCADHGECDFYFPGIVIKDEMVVAVNAGGAAHRKAAKLRRDITQLLEEETYDE